MFEDKKDVYKKNPVEIMEEYTHKGKKYIWVNDEHGNLCRLSVEGGASNTIPINIKYAGRPMLVKVIREYKANDGSIHVDVKDMNNGQVATLIKDYIDEEGGASGPVKIEYKGKEKTVEIMNEYTHKNGKRLV